MTVDPLAPFFPPDSVIRRVDGEWALLLGGGRALLMQLAHPLVAKGVAEHSDFKNNPFDRLQRTLDASWTIVFGTNADAARTAAVIHRVHDRVVGADYHANDPELLLWVHATLVDTALRVHRRFLGGLSDDEAEEFYAESMIVASLLGVPMERQPADLTAFRTYVRTMISTLVVSEEAKHQATEVLHPKLPLPLTPLMPFVRQLTVGLLPQPLRDAYGLRWDPARAVALDAASVAARQFLSRLPARLRRAA